MNEYKVGETFNLQVEITDDKMKEAVVNHLQHILKSNYPEIIPGLKLNSISANDNTMNNSAQGLLGTNWAPTANCVHDCSRCQAKCLYRKEKYQTPKIEKPRYNGEWVDMSDKKSVAEMFGTIVL